MAESVPDLTPQEQTFVEEYCKDKNQVRAALAAGLSPTYFGASQAARTLLKNPQIRDAVHAIFRTQARRLKTEVPDVLREWAILGTSDLTDYVVDDKGRVTTAPGVPRSALRAVKKVKQTRTEKLTGRGEAQELTVEVRTEIELHAKDGPLTKLYEHLHGALPGEQAKGGGGIPIEHAVEFAEFLAARRLSGVVPSGVPVVPEDGAAEPGVPE
jgi:phage terminase small subunit